MHSAVVLIVIVFAIIRALMNAGKNFGGGTGSGSMPRERGPRVNPEEERARRFLEALGRPPGAMPPPPVQPRPARDPAAPMPTIQPPRAPGQLRRSRMETELGRPLPQPMARPLMPQAYQLRRAAPPASPAPPASAAPSAGLTGPAAALPLAGNPLLPEPVVVIATGELEEVRRGRVPRAPAWERGEVGGDNPYGQAVAGGARGEGGRNAAPEILALLRGSGGARKAMILREVLGPPRGLQD